MDAHLYGRLIRIQIGGWFVPSSMKPAAIVLPLLLTACASPATKSGFLSTYDGMAPRTDTVRAKVTQRRDEARLAGIQKVALEPAVLAANAPWLTAPERRLLLREIDAQLCFELSERYEIVQRSAGAHRVRAAVTAVEPTGRVSSAASAAASFFIPGPLGLRAPGTLGSLAAEAELLDGDQQIAAIAWNRAATPVGTDNPSLSRVGDALQFAEPFADAAAAAMTAPGAQPRKIGTPDPCAQFGARFRVEGFAAKFATGLYVPEMSGAKASEVADETPPPSPDTGGFGPGSDP